MIAVATAMAPRASAESKQTDATAKAEKARAISEDLRYGHWLISARGGLWLPSSSLIPTGLGLSPLIAGGGAHLRVGAGVNGYLLLFAEGGVGHATGGSACAVCRATSVDAGLGLAVHLTQGFAIDPWISYAAGYRHTFLKVDDVPVAVSSSSVPAFDFTKIVLGVDYYPAAVFGFGPFFATDVGVRSFSEPVVYADFQAGLRITFDPRRAGKRLTLSASR
jgi:hypothetical protein